MLVKAAPNIKFPREDKPRNYIEQEAVDVPESTYYHRALLDGDLVMANADVQAAPPPATPAAPKPKADTSAPSAGT
ncbi:DUF2635 domain-containing protein [Ralstonia pseudosolanacearum]|uniref:DUF2635 domain-containing protein n=1 Tax=Ralstonia pseudosolanacearum TaxID=1310165 RepID=UPI0018695895|nr:DUF2635 domain-containing protein [Ralstonia pseudosolanacearum]QOK91574.1 DUF2635 domain-containing protein [Ralstonia pseudosolanacearum]